MFYVFCLNLLVKMLGFCLKSLSKKIEILSRNDWIKFVDFLIKTYFCVSPDSALHVWIIHIIKNHIKKFEKKKKKIEKFFGLLSQGAQFRLVSFDDQTRLMRKFYVIELHLVEQHFTLFVKIIRKKGKCHMLSYKFLNIIDYNLRRERLPIKMKTFLRIRTLKIKYS